MTSQNIDLSFWIPACRLPILSHLLIGLKVSEFVAAWEFEFGAGNLNRRQFMPPKVKLRKIRPVG
jgi:hypothetical protein